MCRVIVYLFVLRQIERGVKILFATDVFAKMLLGTMDACLVAFERPVRNVFVWWAVRAKDFNDRFTTDGQRLFAFGNGGARVHFFNVNPPTETALRDPHFHLAFVAYTLLSSVFLCNRFVACKAVFFFEAVFW